MLFTFFRAPGFYAVNEESLELAARRAQSFYSKWGWEHQVCAWAPGLPKPEWKDQLAESLAAGRTIELIDGRYVARGVEEPQRIESLADMLRKAGDRLPSKTPTLDKLEAEHAGNAAMIARDGIAKAKGAPVIAPAPVSTAKPALSFLAYSPDLQPSSHQVGPAFGSALLRG